MSRMVDITFPTVKVSTSWGPQRFGQYDLDDLSNSLVEQLFLTAGLGVPKKGLRKNSIPKTTQMSNF